ncbi:hypothetical protein EXIGLDRAFT_841614 [Exidia glandulosa HHB12029]|uniref:F-box domain-containing protein n=1 Tax=Exidia glandulosa HHB12029 TaxID=1314781 RepID=A0A165DSL5_EXIGL|nr:hypothetical protein EXIGLDRAFT_841614 [Exidia glandulosa HHB12029]
MDEHRFSRLFPPELEHRILALLGHSDLTRTALACRRFRDLSVSLLFRHIALRSVHFDDKGDAVYRTLNNSCKAIFRILDNITLGRHVRFLEVYVPWLFGTVDHGRAAGMTTDELYTVWSSMPGLVALSVSGPIPNDQDLGLQDIDFPRLQRLELSRPDCFIGFLQRHLPRLQHLSVVGVTNIPADCDLTVDTLVHYEGPYLLLMRLLHAGTRTHSLESCAVFGDIGSGTPPTLAPLARYQTLRYLSIGLDADRTTLLEMIRDCPPFTGVKSLKIDFEDEYDWNTQMVPTSSTDPPWSQLIRPFPAALYLVFIVDMEYDVVSERGLAWAKEISETCKDAVVIVLSDFGFTRAGPDFDWVADDEAEDAIDGSLYPSVVHAVSR